MDYFIYQYRNDLRAGTGDLQLKKVNISCKY